MSSVQDDKRATKPKDADLTTNNISKCSVDAVYTSLLNTPEKKFERREKTSMEKIQVDNEVINHKRKRMCDDIGRKVVKKKNRTYKCEHCEKYCKRISSLDEHKAKVHSLKKDADFITTNISKCPVDQVYAPLLDTQVKKGKKNETKIRVETVTVKERTICDEPKENSDSVFNTTVHTNELPIGKFYECDICRKSFEFLSALDKHKTNCHVTVTSRYVGPYICTFCGKTFENTNSLSAHKCTGKSSIQCEICHKKYSTRSILRYHYRTHTGEKPYACDLCGSAFVRNDYLTNHYKIHSGERPFMCVVCDRQFLRREYLFKHYRLHTGERPYACDVCSKTFSNYTNLTTHRRIHTGERPYACNVCGKTFVDKGHLTRHYRIHTGEKPYKCDICETSFTAISTRNYHMLRKHDSRF